MQPKSSRGKYYILDFTNMKSVRTRIAPSPTGNLHIGTARTALFNFLYAKKHGGAFVLRIEDTDRERSTKEFEKNILSGLEWLGIHWDEGPEIGSSSYRGDYAPYRQSERIFSYKKYLEKLLFEEKAFYCFHTEKELANEKKAQMESKIPVQHICTPWRDLPKRDAEKKCGAGEASIIRFKMPPTSAKEPSNYQLTFRDIIRGQVHFFARLLGDFPIAKSSVEPLYNFAVVIDDYEMQITHVIRGEDHIPNTPKQLLIAKALGWTTKNTIGDTIPPWEYVHLPLILGPDRSKLSKRHGATSVDEYRQAGYLSDTLFNFMALIGWNPGDAREKMTKEVLIKEFSLEKVQKSGAIFDTTKLDWLNGEYIRSKTSDELFEIARPYFDQAGISADAILLKRILALEQPRLKKLSELGEGIGFFFAVPEYNKELLRWKQMSDEDVAQSLKKSAECIAGMTAPFNKEVLQKLFFDMIGEGDKGAALWPLRVALSGKKSSPGPFELLEILGREVSLRRLQRALELAGATT